MSKNLKMVSIRMKKCTCGKPLPEKHPTDHCSLTCEIADYIEHGPHPRGSHSGNDFLWEVSLYKGTWEG